MIAPGKGNERRLRILHVVKGGSVWAVGGWSAILPTIGRPRPTTCNAAPMTFPPTMLAATDYESAQIQIALVMALFALLSWLAALAAREQAKKAAALAEERHRDDQLRRFQLSFDTGTQKLVLANTSTTATWNRVVIFVVNDSTGPIVALGDAPPEPMGEPPRHFINLGRVETSEVRPITVERSEKYPTGIAIVRLTCWRNGEDWSTLLECEIPPPPPPPPQIFSWPA